MVPCRATPHERKMYCHLMDKVLCVSVDQVEKLNAECKQGAHYCLFLVLTRDFLQGNVPFLPGCWNLGFALSCERSTQIHTNTHSKVTNNTQVKHIVATPRRFLLSFCPLPLHPAPLLCVLMNALVTTSDLLSRL